ncbi:unnamed protein product [Caenorhabditis brenneri]
MLAEANNTIDSLEEKSKKESMEYKKEKEGIKDIHKMKLKELNTKITELSENESVDNDLETHNKENTGEKSELVTAEEMNEKPIRKRKGEKTKSGDKEQPKL